MKDHPLKKIASLQNKNIPIGICSVCSANKMVIEATMKRAMDFNTHVLIEATANQVNQFGGYTGMTPAKFKLYVESIADSVGFDKDNIILGGDHLGPLTFRHEDADRAMDKAKDLVKAYVIAGFTKIHIDTSMKLGGDDPDGNLSTSVIASRGGAKLIKECDEAYHSLSALRPKARRPVYVVGSEVPFPGGANDDEGIQVTSVEDFEETIAIYKQTFSQQGIQDLWEDVIALVVQPGVEFGSDYVDEYDRAKASGLIQKRKDFASLVFEGHSTDYQQAEKLKQLVEDGVAILKVGPGLTFALRESLFALSRIEEELFANKKDISDLVNVVDQVMVDNPGNWFGHYQGDECEQKLARKYSFYDRSRYYMNDPCVQSATDQMFENYKDTQVPPLSLLSQFLPVQYQKIRKGSLKKRRL